MLRPHKHLAIALIEHATTEGTVHTDRWLDNTFPMLAAVTDHLGPIADQEPATVLAL